MNKNIKSILNKSSKNDGSFLGNFLKYILKRSLLLIIIISLSLHVFDSVDNYSYANKRGGNIELPPGHPKVAPGADFTKCPYHTFRNKYSHCNQCSPVIKYVYNLMEEPYKYVESRAIIPMYKNVWKPYCSKPFMMSLEKGFIPAYRYVKPLVNEKVVQPVQRNVIPKAIELYDTYAKEHVDNANEKVFRPALVASSKYANQAYTVMKPYSIKAKDYTVNNIIKPSIPYVNKAKVRAIQYGNQFLDTLAEVPYQKLLKRGTGKTLRYIGYAENNVEKAYFASTPFIKKYWNVLSRKTDVLMKQDNVQKVVTHPYVQTTTHAIKDAYNIWSDGVKTIYVYLTRRGPEISGTRNWKEANNKVSIKNDIKNSIDFTKRYFKGIIKQLESEDNMDKTIPEIKERKINVNKEETVKNVVKEKPAEKITKQEIKAKKETTKAVQMDAKTIAMEKAKIKQKVKSVVMKEFKNTISKQIAEEKRRQSTKTISPAEAKTKQVIKERATDTKEVAQEKATKDIAKNDYETTKQLTMEKANAETKKIAKERAGTTKEIIEEKQEKTTKDNVKNFYETSKQVTKEKANAETKRIAREKVETAKNLVLEKTTKDTVKNDYESSKQLTMEKANAETKKLAKENVDSAKHLAKENASKNIAREKYETSKQLVMEKAIKEE